MNIKTGLIFLSVCCLEISGKGYHAKFHLSEKDHCIIIEKGESNYRDFTQKDDLQVKSRDAINMPQGQKQMKLEGGGKIVDLYGTSQQSIESYIEENCKSQETIVPISQSSPNAPEIRNIVKNGDPSKRIDVVFMGDGYTLDERTQFFDDIDRLTADMFNGETFRSYLPLFNIWAIFVESVDSGIGYNGALDTPFKLYRSQGQLRGIFTGNPQYARQVCAMTGPGGCDYPSLIGNDDYYGGLGGEFVISTKSSRTGTVVLRHEMGHNFVDVGEEYDSGGVYSGVNSSPTLNLKWKHWLTNGENSAREEKVQWRVLEYPWTDLAHNNVSFTFQSEGVHSSWYAIVSVSAASEEDCLEFTLDGEKLPWQSSGFEDREFYDWHGSTGLSAGTHTFTVRSVKEPTNDKIDRMIASIDIHEFGNDDEWIEDNEHISAYPTWDYLGRKTYRPTNAGCLMRNMTHNKLCSVCKEGMWMEFFKIISLIDDLEILKTEDGETQVILHTLKLGQLRAPGNEVEGETLSVRWNWNGIDQDFLNDDFIIDALPGRWTVTCTFNTQEVRSDPNNLLTDNRAFIID